jgi:hypothetical protein
MHIPADHLSPREVRREWERAYSRPQPNHSVFRRAEPAHRSARAAALIVLAISVVMMAVSIVGLVRSAG